MTLLPLIFPPPLLVLILLVMVVVMVMFAFAFPAVLSLASLVGLLVVPHCSGLLLSLVGHCLRLPVHRF